MACARRRSLRRTWRPARLKMQRATPQRQRNRLMPPQTWPGRWRLMRLLQAARSAARSMPHISSSCWRRRELRRISPRRQHRRRTRTPAQISRLRWRNCHSAVRQRMAPAARRRVRPALRRMESLPMRRGKRAARQALRCIVDRVAGRMQLAANGGTPVPPFAFQCSMSSGLCYRAARICP